jgi:hypothetical protein
VALREVLAGVAAPAAAGRAVKMLDEIMRCFDAIQKTGVRYNAVLEKPYLKTIVMMSEAQKKNEKTIKEASEKNAKLEERVEALEKKLAKKAAAKRPSGAAPAKRKPAKGGAGR